MPWLTPAELPEGTKCRVFQIPDNTDLLAAFYGAILPLTYAYNWQVPPEGGITPQEAASLFMDMYDESRLSGEECVPTGCDCIKDLSFNSATGALTYTDENGDEQTIFNANELSLTFTSYANLVPPPVTDVDKYCYAAHSLYRDWADSLGDILELVIADAAVTESAIKGLISFPTLGLTPAEELVDFLGAIANAALNYAKSNIADVDASNLGAEVLYCAMLAAAQEDDLENLWDYVEWADALPEFAFSLNAWENFGEWAEWLYEQASGEFMAWYVLAYSRFGLFQWGELLGMVEPIEKEVAAYANRAENFDSRDCSEFECDDEWCIEWDFSIEDHDFNDYNNAGRGHWNGVDAWTSDTVDGTTRTDIASPIFTACTVTRLEVDRTVDYTEVSPNRYADVRDDSNNVLDETDESAVSDGTGTDGFEVGSTGVRQIRVAYQTATGGGGGSAQLFKIRMYGTGEAPPELTTCP